ncbi:hypothetical protein VNO78_01883 [Psophocarpus tetragonolobus]|uniref:Uncharacterized protein n=1 Tax=Psophocarpus tetragonolobus TaxID=3891 RepID=A0AAN9XUU7_PSOTE
MASVLVSGERGRFKSPCRLKARSGYGHQSLFGAYGSGQWQISYTCRWAPLCRSAQEHVCAKYRYEEFHKPNMKVGINAMKNIDSDRWSYFEALFIVRGLGYKDKNDCGAKRVYVDVGVTGDCIANGVSIRSGAKGDYGVEGIYVVGGAKGDCGTKGGFLLG